MASLSMSNKWRPFPELKPSEIIQIMGELNIPLSDQELLKPTPQAVQRTFEMLVSLFMGSDCLSKTLSSSSSFAVLSLLEYPDLHTDALALASFHRLV